MRISSVLTADKMKERVRREQAFLSTLPNSFAYADTLTGKLCGEFLEVYRTRETQRTGEHHDKTKSGQAVAESQESLLARSIRRSQTTIRRACNANRFHVLHTLTFAIRHPEYFAGEKRFVLVPLIYQTDRDIVLAMWRKFARKMRAYEESKGRTFRYIAVIEKHAGKRADKPDSDKIGTYHVHFASDRIHSKRLLQAKWGHGLCNYADWSVGIKKDDLDNEHEGEPVDNPGAYLSKYTGKDMDGEFPGRKRYWTSKGLKKPIALHGDEVKALIYGQTPIFSTVKEIDIDGQIFRQYKATFRVGGTFHGPPKPNKVVLREKRKKEQGRRISERICHMKQEILDRDQQWEDNYNGKKNGVVKEAFTRKRRIDRQTKEGFR